jgi:hypothetical protein
MEGRAAIIIMAENIPIEDPDYVPWYLDEASHPVCPSFWEDFECDRPSCPFSHKTARFMTSVVFTEDLTSDLLAMHKFLLSYISNHPNKELITTHSADPNIENEKEFEKIDQLFDEMAEFERGANFIEPGTFCYFLKETGNCVLKGLCEYSHSQVDDPENEGDWQDVWYPDCMSCECCKGYVYKCSVEACKSNGKCLECVGKGV